MKEQPKTCQTCSFFQELPFTDREMYCINPDSEYAECECSEKDTCDSWEGRQ